MSQHTIEIGEEVTNSPVGPGRITGFSDGDWPRVNDVTVVWVVFKDGSRFDPYLVGPVTRIKDDQPPKTPEGG